MSLQNRLRPANLRYIDDLDILLFECFSRELNNEIPCKVFVHRTPAAGDEQQQGYEQVLQAQESTINRRG